MDNSDDYFFDDIVLDDQALAILDQSEQKYLKETSAIHTTTVTSKPVNKRLKTTDGWVPGIGASESGDDELPEILLQKDGSYGVNNRTNPPRGVGQGVFPQAKQSNDIRFNRITDNRVQGNSRSPYTSVPGPPVSYTTSTNDRQRQHYQTAQNQNSGQASKQNKDTNTLGSPTLAQLVDLQKRLDELREENLKMKSALQQAVDIKLAKEGEVTILRKSIEKNAQVHGAQIQQLKAEKDRADAKQAQMQRDLQNEMEKLRTQFLFRQNELESSVLRKTTASVRAKKLGKDFPSTPMAVPPAISGWSRGSQKPAEDTPVRPSRLSSVFNKTSPTKQPRKSPEKIRSGMLPGFENAFETSTPRKSPSKMAVKGKESRIPDLPVFGLESTTALRLPSQLSQGPSQFQFEPPARRTQPQQQDIFSQPGGSALAFYEQPRIKEDDMDIVPAESDEDLVSEDLEVFEQINWKAELCRIILTHSYGSAGEISFQQLLTSHFAESPNNYAISCGRILEVISNPVKADDYEDSINAAAMSFLSLLATLTDSRQKKSTLAIVFNLLAKLVASLPTFQANLLSCELLLQDNRVLTITGIICSTILEYLQPATPQSQQDDLAIETLSLLDLLCFHVDAKSMERLEPLARNREVLMTLIHPSQPVWLLERTSRLLALLSTYHQLYKVLLDTSSGGMDANSDVQLKDVFVERLCTHLIDMNRPPTEVIRINILSYFGQLSISHPVAHGILGASYTLIPSLVLYISQITSPLWEDDGSLACSGEITSTMVKALKQATFLLYHLIFGIEPNLNLRYKLQHAPHRPFNSISHIFVVTFGRLSYCDPPSWMDSATRQDLETLAEISREILEVVVDGPEGDSVWSAFQTEPSEDNMIDEEEMEAQLMGTDNDV